MNKLKAEPTGSGSICKHSSACAEKGATHPCMCGQTPTLHPSFLDKPIKKKNAR